MCKTNKKTVTLSTRDQWLQETLVMQNFYLEGPLSLLSTKNSFLGEISWNDKKRTRMVPTAFILLVIVYSPREPTKSLSHNWMNIEHA